MQRYMVISLILCLVCVSQFVNVRSARAQSGSPSPTAGGKLTGDVRIDSDLCCKWELTPDTLFLRKTKDFLFNNANRRHFYSIVVSRSERIPVSSEQLL